MSQAASASDPTNARRPLRTRRRALVVVASVPLLLLLLGFLAEYRGMAAEPGEFTVVANARVPVSVVDKEFLARAFLKKLKTWSDDTPIQPVDLDPKSAVRDRFSRRVLGRSVSAVRSYWQQVLFSGRDVPPPELDDDEAVLRFVRERAGAVGYISAREDLRVEGVKVLAIR